MATHESLDIWKLSIEFVTKIYSYTKDFPSDEKFGLVSQMRRAAVSIPSNIAEGAARKYDKEFIRLETNIINGIRRTSDRNCGIFIMLKSTKEKVFGCFL